MYSEFAYAIFLILESHVMVPCFSKFLLPKLPPTLKPIETIAMAIIFPVFLLHFKYVRNAISPTATVVPIAICGQPIISRIVLSEFYFAIVFLQKKSTTHCTLLKTKRHYLVFYY